MKLQIRVRSLVSASLISSLLLVGCGTADTPKGTASNWTFYYNEGNDLVKGVSIYSFTGALYTSGTNITGVLHTSSVSLPGCDVAIGHKVTGTLNPDGTMNLAVPIAGGTANFSPAKPNVENVTITGGACDQPQIPMYASRTPNVTGTYKGTYIENSQAIRSGAASEQIIVTLTQGSMPDENGIFPLSGSVNMSGSCTTAFSFENGSMLGAIIQSVPISLTSSPQVPSTPWFNGGASAPPAAPGSLGLTVTTPSGCPAGLYNATLSLQ